MKLNPNSTKEPVGVVAGLSSAVSAVIALLVSFGLPVTPEQSTAILGVVAVAAPLVVIVSRKFVTPVNGIGGCDELGEEVLDTE